MATTRASGIARKAVALTNGQSTILMMNSDMRDLVLPTVANITWTMTFGSLDEVNAGTAVYVATPAAADGVQKLSGITCTALKATAAGAATALALWKH